MIKALIEKLEKSKKPFPVGTVRNWGGQEYIKHADGWVARGGKNHGKLLGKFKESPTHKEFLDKPEAIKELEKPQEKPYDIELTPSQIEAKKQTESEENKQKRISEIWEKPKTEVAKETPKPKEFTKEEVLKEKQNLEKEIQELQEKIKIESKKETDIRNEFGNLDPSSKEFKEVSSRYAPQSEITRNLRSELSQKTEHYDAIKATAMIPEVYVAYKRGGSKTSKNSSIYKIYVREHLNKITKMKSLGYPISEEVLKNYPGLFEEASPELVARGMKTKSLGVLTTPESGLATGKPSKVEFTPHPEDKSNLVGFVAFGKTTAEYQKVLNKKLQYSSLIVTEMGIKLKTPIDFVCQNVTAKANSRTYGTYHPTNKNRNPLIDIKSNSTEAKTLIHEIGHGVDYALHEGSGSYFENKSYNNEDISNIKKVMVDSPFFQTNNKGKYGSYLRKGSEVFARAFEVYGYKVARDLADSGKIDKDFIEGFIPDALKDALNYNEQKKYVDSNPQVQNLKAEVDKLNAEIDDAHKKFTEAQSKAGMVGLLGEYVKTPEGSKLWNDYHEILNNNNSKIGEIRGKMNTLQSDIVKDFMKQHSFRKDAEEVIEKVSKMVKDLLSKEKIKKGISYIEVDLIKSLLTKLEKGGPGSGPKKGVTDTSRRSLTTQLIQEKKEAVQQLKEGKITEEEFKQIIKEHAQRYLRKGGPGSGVRGHTTNAQSQDSNHIGITTSGKKIYAKHTPENHQDYSLDDHREAMNFHYNVAKNISAKIEEKRKQNPQYKVSPKINQTTDHHFNQAKIHQNQMSRLMTQTSQVKKSEMEMDRNGTTIETSDFALELENSINSKYLPIIENIMTDYNYGDSPKEIPLDNDCVLYIAKVDEGLFSGYVRKHPENEEGLSETLCRIEKMTIPTMIQYLKAKGAIESIEQKETPIIPIVEVPQPIIPEPVQPNNLDEKIRLLEILERIMNAQ